MKAKPTNLREVLLMSAARAAGARGVYMAQAANIARPDYERRLLIGFARQNHHVYLERLREAHAATLGMTVGYFVPSEDVPETPARVDTATVPVLRMSVRQAS